MKNSIFARFFLFITFVPSLFPVVEWTLPSNIHPEFLCGTALAEYQVSGSDNCPSSNWAVWELEGHIKDQIVSETACDFWHLYPQDIQRMRNELSVNAFRFSIEWSAIEPQEGVFSENALQHYEDVINNLLEADIVPMVTLHHFTDPQWFAQRGGFEKEENIYYFVRFCSVIFERLGKKVTFWCTINEPTIYVLGGYLRGVFPPGKVMNIPLAWKVLKHLMIAHERVYKNLKQHEYGQEARIGLVHQYLLFRAYRWWNPIEHLPGLFFNSMMNDSVLNFCRTGVFKIPVFENSKLALGISSGMFAYNAAKNADLSLAHSAVAGVALYSGVNYLLEYWDGYSYNAQTNNLLDFIGLNYYTCVRPKCELSFKEPVKPSCYADKGEFMTDMPYGTYPHGLYEAIVACSKLGVPIYITENGIADAKDDRRGRFIEEYISSMVQAIRDGYDVRGYFYWSLMDNLEWDMGFEQKFGLYAVDFAHPAKIRTLRAGAAPFIEFARAIKDRAGRIKESVLA